MMGNKDFFVHAYNFVRYDKAQKPVRTTPDIKAGITGYLDCSLSVKTPLSIPDSENCVKMMCDKEKNHNIKEHNAYPFYTVDNKPIIPGSEIRGLIRNVYEIITDSCFSVINSNIISSRDITGKKTDREKGILHFDYERNRWILQDASKYTAYTDTTKKKLLEDFKNKDYIERDWALSVQLSTNMQKIKKTVDEALKKASDYDNFWNILEDNKNVKDQITYYPLEDNDGNEVLGFILKTKLDKGENPEENDLLNKLNSVNAAKKWGEQYSLNSINDYFDMSESEKKKYYEKNYTESIINFSIFIPKGEVETDEKQLEEAIEKFNTILDFSEDYAEGNKTILNRIKSIRPSKDKDTPVFYRIENGKPVLTPSHFSREVYDNTVESILGSRKKCDSKDNLCPACSVFGMIGKPQNAVASRVRFSDAKALDGYEIDKEFTTLKVLASPKTTGWEFYADKKYNKSDVTLKGRKMYFHNPAAETDKSVYSYDKKEKFNASVQLMKKGEFAFRVYFDHINEKELRYLILALTLGENSADSKLMHKLGHGKSLGLGSIKIMVNDVVARDMDNYVISHKPEYLDEIKAENPLKKDNLPASKQTLDDLLNICNYDFCKDFKVSYPVVEAAPGLKYNDNDIASHRYFSWMNNSWCFNDNEKQYICNNLPQIGESADEIKMPVIVIAYKDGKKKPIPKTDFVPNQTDYAPQQRSERTFPRREKTTMPQCGEIIEVTAFRSQSNKNGNGYICDFNYGTCRGRAFGLTEFIEKNSKFKIKITAIKNGNQIYGNFYKE